MKSVIPEQIVYNINNIIIIIEIRLWYFRSSSSRFDLILAVFFLHYYQKYYQVLGSQNINFSLLDVPIYIPIKSVTNKKMVKMIFCS